MVHFLLDVKNFALQLCFRQTLVKVYDVQLTVVAMMVVARAIPDTKVTDTMNADQLLVSWTIFTPHHHMFCPTLGLFIYFLYCLSQFLVKLSIAVESIVRYAMGF